MLVRNGDSWLIRRNDTPLSPGSSVEMLSA